METHDQRMHLDADLCYRALASRDVRFDGRFFTAVRTTGVYCRPVCPARTPLRRNVAFYACAAAAEEAGFRPCRRCRPDTSPGTPEWGGTSGTVSRALRLIHDGALDREGVATLSRRLGIGERHLARLFAGHLGASPVAIAQTRRVHFARKLLEETDLPMTEVAYSSGFASIRRFNTAVGNRFGATPTQLRRQAPARREEPAGGDMVLRLPYRPPLDWNALLGFLRPRCTPGVESVEGDTYRRTYPGDEHAGVIQVRPGYSPHTLELTIPATLSREILRIVEKARRFFDLLADPAAVAEHLGGDELLAARIRRRPGIRVPGAWSGFEVAVRAILGQQVSVAGATTVAGRLAARYGRPFSPGRHGLTRLFPVADDLVAARFGGIGLTAGRHRAIRALARAVRDGAIDLEPSADPEETTGRLQELPGIGPWTASYVAMRALRHPDAFPAEDLWLRRALSSNNDPVPARQLLERAEGWRPWRAYAAMYLWDQGD
jgi:AraC family transcriptional regulator of adaptative response / DNA-3-methyladenine glycosylase II